MVERRSSFRAEQGTVWLTQAQMAELFDTTKQNVSLHMTNILAEGEAGPSVVKESLIPASDGKRYRTKIYNLDAILAVGYRSDLRAASSFVGGQPRFSGSTSSRATPWTTSSSRIPTATISTNFSNGSGTFGGNL